MKFLSKKENPSITEIEKHMSKQGIKTTKGSGVSYPTIQKHLDYMHRKGMVDFSNDSGVYRAKLLKNIRVYVEDVK